MLASCSIANFLAVYEIFYAVEFLLVLDCTELIIWLISVSQAKIMVVMVMRTYKIPG